jgi:hypothetical protein
MATLVSTITESITLNGKERGSTNTLSIGSVEEVFHRIVTCPSGSDTTVATFKAATSTSDGALDLDNVKYVRDLESLLVDPSSNNVTVEVFIAC